MAAVRETLLSLKAGQAVAAVSAKEAASPWRRRSSRYGQGLDVHLRAWRVEGVVKQRTDHVRCAAQVFWLQDLHTTSGATLHGVYHVTASLWNPSKD